MGKKAALCRRCCPHRKAKADIAASRGGSGSGGKRQSECCGRLGRADIGNAPCDMTVGDMGRLVGDDGLKHLGRFEAQQHPEMDVNMVVVDNEGIEAALIDDQNPYIPTKPGSRQDRGCGAAERVFDIGIADQ